VVCEENRVIKYCTSSVMFSATHYIFMSIIEHKITNNQPDIIENSYERNELGQFFLRKLLKPKMPNDKGLC
jgi:hypothetical protein